MKPLDAADMLMEKLIFTQHRRRLQTADRRHNVDLWAFDRVDPLHFVRDPSDEAFLISDADERRAYVDPAVVWPFHVQRALPAGSSWPTGTVAVVEHRSCSLAEARALGATRFAQRMTSGKAAYITPDGAESAMFVNAFIGRRWVNARDARTWQTDRRLGDGIPAQTWKLDRTKDEDHNPVAMAQSLALIQRYEWAVRVGFDVGPKIRFSTDAAGLRAMFRDRDKPADRDRRSPLRHWVREHWRKSRVDEEAMSFVIAHLRGREAFRWWGYDCVIEPSQYDLERLERRSATGVT